MKDNNCTNECTRIKVMITGTSRGIGKGIAEYFLERGYFVIGLDIKEGAISHPSYRHYLCDIRDLKCFPDTDLPDILINCAGTQNENDIDTNLKGTMNITEHFGIHPGIRSILIIGSASAHTGSEFPEYAASKGGLLSYTKNVALRVARFGAVCNSLDFGGVLTELNAPVIEDRMLWQQIMDLTPLKRWMTVSEAAEWAYFMTVTNRFCTGQNILIDGLEAGNSHFVWPDN